MWQITTSVPLDNLQKFSSSKDCQVLPHSKKTLLPSKCHWVARSHVYPQLLMTWAFHKSWWTAPREHTYTPRLGCRSCLDMQMGGTHLQQRLWEQTGWAGEKLKGYLSQALFRSWNSQESGELFPVPLWTLHELNSCHSSVGLGTGKPLNHRDAVPAPPTSPLFLRDPILVTFGHLLIVWGLLKVTRKYRRRLWVCS